MEETIMSEKTLRIMFYLLALALLIIALKPSKIIVLGSANDNHGNITVDGHANNERNDIKDKGLSKAKKEKAKK